MFYIMSVLQVKRVTEAVLEMAKGLPEELTKIIVTEVSKRLEERDQDQKEKLEMDEKFESLRQDMESNIEAKVREYCK